MNAFLAALSEHNLKPQECLRRKKLNILQVNMGNLCNQACRHCHIGDHPASKKIMSKEVVNDILAFLIRYQIPTLDITGGAPELNPNFEHLVEKARRLVEEIIVRTNLTVIFEKGKEKLIQFYKDNQVHLICSLPS